MTPNTMYLMDKVNELHNEVVKILNEIEENFDISDYSDVALLSEKEQSIISLLHHIECETCM